MDVAWGLSKTSISSTLPTDALSISNVSIIYGQDKSLDLKAWVQCNGEFDTDGLLKGDWNEIVHLVDMTMAILQVTNSRQQQQTSSCNNSNPRHHWR